MKKSFLASRHDGYDNTSVSAQVGVKAFLDSWLSLTFRYTDANMKIANGAFEEDKNHTFDNENLSLNVTYSIPLFEWWESTLNFSYMSQYQRDKNLPDFYEYMTQEILSGYGGSFGYSNMTYKGKTLAGEFKNKFKILDIDEIICGVSYEREHAETLPYWFSWNEFFSMSMDPTSPIDKKAGTWAAYVQNHLKLFKRIFIIAGARYTKPDHFRHSLNYGISGSFIIPVTETRFKASVGTGYKTPSLYQLYNTFERYDRFSAFYLRPERTMSYDAGIEQPLWNNKIILGVNYFSIDYKNMIVYDLVLDSYGRYWNNDALSRGVECIGSIKPIDGLSINAYYTFTRMQDKTFHTGDMVRRPRHQTGASVNYEFMKKVNANVGFTYVGKRRDYWSYPYFSRMNPYYKLDMALSWWVIEQLQVYVRAENVLNKKYEEVRGYRTPKLSIYGGLKVAI